MTKVEMIAALAEKGYSKKTAEKALADVFGVITDTLVKGEKVSVSGFGIFEVRDRAEKTVINPQTKKTVVVPARKVPAYKAAKALKEKIAK